MLIELTEHKKHMKEHKKEKKQLQDELMVLQPVSYTHLDVYKRQTMSNASLPLSP